MTEIAVITIKYPPKTDNCPGKESVLQRRNSVMSRQVHGTNVSVVAFVHPARHAEMEQKLPCSYAG